MQVRSRTAIALFGDRPAALRARAALLRLGLTSSAAMLEPLSDGTGETRLLVQLPSSGERKILNCLLTSDAQRVDVHDTEH